MSDEDNWERVTELPRRLQQMGMPPKRIPTYRQLTKAGYDGNIRTRRLAKRRREAYVPSVIAYFELSHDEEALIAA
jgi:hypothetical protein